MSPLTLDDVAHELGVDGDDVAALVDIGLTLGEQRDRHHFEGLRGSVRRV